MNNLDRRTVKLPSDHDRGSRGLQKVLTEIRTAKEIQILEVLTSERARAVFHCAFRVRHSFAVRHSGSVIISCPLSSRPSCHSACLCFLRFFEGRSERRR